MWTCKVCNVTVESEKAFKSHRKSHVKCSDCSFEGAPKIVKAHYQAMHGKFSVSGFKTIKVGVPGCRPQKFRICVGNRPEDIQRWIAERKKRFPRSKPTTAIDTVSTNTNATAATESKQEQGTKDQHNEEKADSTGLSSLLAGYGSSSDEDDNDNSNSDNKDKKAIDTPMNPKGEGPGNVPPSTHVDNSTSIGQIESIDRDASNSNPNLQQDQQTKARIRRPCRFFFRNGSCRNGSNCRFSHEMEEGQQQSQQQQQRNLSQPSKSGSNRNKNNAKKRKRGGHTSSDTLLRKLLENDMERESTLTMQLLKFIVDNNFFLDDEASSKPKAKCDENSTAEEIKGLTQNNSSL